MRYVITGATSFVGIELTERLLADGHSVVAVCRAGSSGIPSLPQGVDVVCSDMEEYEILNQKIPSADVFVNLAWKGTGHDGRNVVDIQKENVAFSLAAMGAAKRMGCGVFVEAGSQAEYGSTLAPQREDMECNPFSEYGKAKLAMKNEAFRQSEQLGIRYVHLRIFSLFGENDHPWTLVMSALDKMMRNEDVDLSPCSQNWNFLYIKDAVNQIAGICNHAFSDESFVHEVFNIASDDTRVLKDFVEEMKVISHSQSTLNYGAMIPQNLVSLQPLMDKTCGVCGKLADYSFSDVIQLILSKKQTTNEI